MNARDRHYLSLKTYAQIMRASDAVTANMHRHLAEHGLTISQFGVLEALYHLGPLCQRDLGKKILKTSGNITTVIDNLEKQELVVRQRDMKDRRYFLVELTPAGLDLIKMIFPNHAAIARQVFSILNTDELMQLGQLMKKLGKANSPGADARMQRPGPGSEERSAR